MIKFHCATCGQKLGVPEKYAGRKVRCTGCKEPVRVPELEPALEEVHSSEIQEVHDDHHDDSHSGFNPLDDLAALGSPSGELQELQTAPAQAAASSCPKCGSAVSPNAVICIQCGNNLKAGGKVKTKVSKEKVGGGGGLGIGIRQVAAFFVGAIVAGIGGFVWFIIALFGFELGILAWGIGGLTGLSVALIYHRYSVVAGVGAALCTLFGLIVGKGLILLALTGMSMIPQAMDSLGDVAIDANLKDPELFAMTYSGYMEEEKLFDPELQARIDAVPEDEFYDEALYDEMQAAAEAKAAGMSEEEKRAFLDSYFAMDSETDAEFDASMDELRNLNAWSETFSLWDCLWFPLALGTGFQVGRGRDA